jgi:hypothetical protein|tara:strand:- start:2211 stop:2873 length:663 start_codon:yes stop_codon:yes gene_type:complete
MKPIVKTIAALDDDADGISVSQTPAAGGVQDLTITGALATGGVATMAAAQIITATWAGADGARTLTVTYKDADGIETTGTIGGASSTTSQSTFYAKSVSNISIDDNSAGAFTVGVLDANGAVSPTVRVNSGQTSSFKVGLFVELSVGASLVYTVEHSPDWPENGNYTAGYSNAANWYSTDGLSALTATNESNIVIPVECVRLTLTSQVSGTAKLTVSQAY